MKQMKFNRELYSKVALIKAAYNYLDMQTGDTLSEMHHICYCLDQCLKKNMEQKQYWK